MRLVHFLARWSAYTPAASLPQHGDCQTVTYACLPLGLSSIPVRILHIPEKMGAKPFDTAD